MTNLRRILAAFAVTCGLASFSSVQADVVYKYDALGRLIKMSDDVSNSRICYFYDEMGNRQTVSTAATPCDNAAPVFVSDPNVVFDQWSGGATVYPLSNDTDADGDSLSAININYPSGLYGSYDNNTKAFSFGGLSSPGYYTVTYFIDDGNGGTDDASLIVDVRPAPCPIC